MVFLFYTLKCLAVLKTGMSCIWFEKNNQAFLSAKITNWLFKWNTVSHSSKSSPIKGNKSELESVENYVLDGKDGWTYQQRAVCLCCPLCHWQCELIMNMFVVSFHHITIYGSLNCLIMTPRFLELLVCKSAHNNGYYICQAVQENDCITVYHRCVGVSLWKSFSHVFIQIIYEKQSKCQCCEESLDCRHVFKCVQVLCVIVVRMLVLKSCVYPCVLWVAVQWKQIREGANLDNELKRKEQQGQSLARFHVGVSFIFTVIWQLASGWLGQQISSRPLYNMWRLKHWVETMWWHLHPRSVMFCAHE